MSVPPRSLSIVFGTPITGRPCAPCSSAAAPSVSSPPIAIRPSRLSVERFSRMRSAPSSCLKGFVRELRRMVPPRGGSARRLDRELLVGVLDRAAPAVAAHDRVSVAIDPLAHDRADHRVEAGTVATSVSTPIRTRRSMTRARPGNRASSESGGVTGTPTALLAVLASALVLAGCLGSDEPEHPRDRLGGDGDGEPAPGRRLRGGGRSGGGRRPARARRRRRAAGELSIRLVVRSSTEPGRPSGIPIS